MSYKRSLKFLFILTAAIISFLIVAILPLGCNYFPKEEKPLAFVSTLYGRSGELGEPFGIASTNDAVYFSDGEKGVIWKAVTTGKAKETSIFAQGFDTPSGLAMMPDGRLIVADTGDQTIKSVDQSGNVTIIAGSSGKRGNADGSVSDALFNGPIGVAIGAGTIYVADAYNDRIRSIKDGKVATVAGSARGFADGIAAETKFDTPSGIAVWKEGLIIADTGNSKLRFISADGAVSTISGGDWQYRDGLLYESSLVQPTSIAIGNDGDIYFTDLDTIRVIRSIPFPHILTLSDKKRGLADGILYRSGFLRPSGLAFDQNGRLLVADSGNGLVRSISADRSDDILSRSEIASLGITAEKFRELQPPRWPYDPPQAVRDIAGTLGELRGDITQTERIARFHNGLDIAGAYGETARFVRTEKVLSPVAAENFGDLRELIRLPSMGYIHIRLGRSSDGKIFDDKRFIPNFDSTGKLSGMRVPRGVKFNAGDAIGTLNSMNHVHLIAGSTGAEMNAIDALKLPGLKDSRAPTIVKAFLTDANFNELETSGKSTRIKVNKPFRVIVQAFDQMDGNPERRRLGVYSIGYVVVNTDKDASPNWTIRFDRMPPNEASGFVYAPGSHSGATGETIFNYIATNYLEGDDFGERSIDPSTLSPGDHTIRVSVGDYFGNTVSKDIEIEVVR